MTSIEIADVSVLRELLKDLNDKKTSVEDEYISKGIKVFIKIVYAFTPDELVDSNVYWETTLMMLNNYFQSFKMLLNMAKYALTTNINISTWSSKCSLIVETVREMDFEFDDIYTSEQLFKLSYLQLCDFVQNYVEQRYTKFAEKYEYIISNDFMIYSDSTQIDISVDESKQTNTKKDCVSYVEPSNVSAVLASYSDLY